MKNKVSIFKDLVQKQTSKYLRRRGYSEYAISELSARIFSDVFIYRNVPLSKRLWALKHGFFANKINYYGLNASNLTDYLSDFDYYWLHPLNGSFSHWIDDKLTIRYFLIPFSEYLPEYYYHISENGTLRLYDCPADCAADVSGLINLLGLKGDLAAKPAIGTAGSGFYRITCKDQGYFVNDSLVSEIELIKIIENWRIMDGGYIVTEYLHPHPYFGRIWDQTSNALRITILRKPGQQAQIAQGFTRFGNRKSGIVDNTHAGGIINYLDIETGCFTDGKLYEGDRMIDCHVHPETGVPVEGTVPYWQKIKDKLIEITDFIPQLSFLGFDIVVVEGGFKIIEINSHPDMQVFQWYTPINTDKVMRSFFESMITAKKNRFKSRNRGILKTLREKSIRQGKIIDKFTRFFNFKRQGSNTLEHLSLIRNSGYFNEHWYLEHYPEVREAGIEPLQHYLTKGGFEGCDPGPDFNSGHYLALYDDVHKEGINPLLHYLKYGKYEGRSIAKHEEI